MTKARNLMVAAVMTLAVSACSSYQPADCDYYPREHHENWQEDCREIVDGDTMRSDRTRVRTFNRSMEK